MSEYQSGILEANNNQSKTNTIRKLGKLSDAASHILTCYSTIIKYDSRTDEYDEQIVGGIKSPILVCDISTANLDIVAKAMGNCHPFQYMIRPSTRCYYRIVITALFYGTQNEKRAGHIKHYPIYIHYNGQNLPEDLTPFQVDLAKCTFTGHKGIEYNTLQDAIHSQIGAIITTLQNNQFDGETFIFDQKIVTPMSLSQNKFCAKLILNELSAEESNINKSCINIIVPAIDPALLAAADAFLIQNLDETEDDDEI